MTQAATVPPAKPPTHVAHLNGAVLSFHYEDYETVVPGFVAAQGGGVPSITAIVEAPVAPVVPLVVAAPAEPKVGQYDIVGDARSAIDREAARAAGFTPAAPVYRQGLRADGMRGHRDTFDALPLAAEAAERLERRVAAENRRDVTVATTDVRLNNAGLLALSPRSPRLTIDQRAFGSLVARLGMPAGASTYLAAIEPELRAVNVNHWVAGDVTRREQATRQDRISLGKEYEPGSLVVRTRDSGVAGQRSAFGVVSPDYAEFDADRLAAAVKLATPPGARAQVTYDGHRTKFDVLFFSDIIPEHAVAGEFFKAGVQIRTDDVGGGSLTIDAMIWQNLCLNFIIIDRAGQHVDRIRHIGEPEKLAARFKKAFAAALDKLAHFTEAWGYAQAEDVIPRSLVLARETGVIEAVEPFAVLPVSQVLPGIFNGMIERDLVPLPKRDRKATVAQLMTMWERDTSAAVRAREEVLTRSAVVNAVTRYAHEVNDDAFQESAIEASAGALLFGKGRTAPAALPFLPLAL